MPPTQKDVAERAGVSFITVSRVVNGHPSVKDSTRQRVEEVIRELKYYPSAVGRALNDGRTGTIGLVTPIRIQTHLEGDSFLIGLMDGIERRCSESRIDLLISIENHPERGEDPLRLYYQKKVDGIIFIGFQHIAPEVLQEIHGSSIPCVVIADRPTDASIPWIDTDNEDAGREAVARLLDAGAASVGFVVNDRQRMENLNMSQRLEGGLKELSSRGVDRSSVWIHPVTDFSWESGKAAFREWKALGPSRPAGMVIGNDDLAIGFVLEALASGISIPSDLQVVSFDAIPEGQRLRPSLATFRQPLTDMGYEAARLLEHQIDGLPREGERLTLFKLKFIPGGTLR